MAVFSCAVHAGAQLADARQRDVAMRHLAATIARQSRAQPIVNEKVSCDLPHVSTHHLFIQFRCVTSPVARSPSLSPGKPGFPACLTPVGGLFPLRRATLPGPRIALNGEPAPLLFRFPVHRRARCARSAAESFGDRLRQAFVSLARGRRQDFPAGNFREAMRLLVGRPRHATACVSAIRIGHFLEIVCRAVDRRDTPGRVTIVDRQTRRHDIRNPSATHLRVRRHDSAHCHDKRASRDSRFLHFPDSR
ncbi:protein of unknown function [Burkholderia multivorans]